MTEEQIIVAFELGSSKLTAVAGYKMANGSIKVLASEQEPSSSFIRKGAVYNVDLMTARLKSIKESMESRLTRHIEKAYVAIGGMGMHTVSNMIQQQFSEEQTIKQELIDQILETNAACNYTDRTILDVVPLEYKLGTILQANPIGVVAESIEGNFLNIILRSSWYRQIEKCFEEAGISIVELRTVAQVKAGTLLTDDEMRLGCILVDMGAQTTTVAVYKNDILRHLAALPMGGDNITADISSFNIKVEEAEELKLREATAISSEPEKKPASDLIMLNDGRKLQRSDLNDCVWSRMEEILRNIDEQIKQSKYDHSKLPAGLILTGKAAGLPKMGIAVQELISPSKLRFSNSLSFDVKVEEGNLFGGNVINENYNVVLALLRDGSINCCKAILKEAEPIETEEEEEAETTVAVEEEAKQEPSKAEAVQAEEKKPEKVKKESSWKQRWANFRDKLNDIVGDD